MATIPLIYHFTNSFSELGVFLISKLELDIIRLSFLIKFARDELAFLFFVAILIIFLPDFVLLQKMKQSNKRLYEKVDLLNEKRRCLLKEKQLLLTDPEYREKIARDKFGLAKEGEVVYKIDR